MVRTKHQQRNQMQRRKCARYHGDEFRKSTKLIHPYIQKMKNQSAVVMAAMVASVMGPLFRATRRSGARGM